ncbi:MAG: hypothetical protein RTU63_13320 [Candidatus Thorarchaeota archaeon]
MSSLDRWQVKLCFVLFWAVTLLSPLAIIPMRISYHSGIGWNIDRIYYYIFGTSISESVIPTWWGGIGFTYTIALTIALFSGLIYAYLVTNYYMKQSYLRAAIITGFLGQLVSLMMVLYSLYSLSPEVFTSGDYVGPLPFQFIAGLIVMWIVKSRVKLPES